MRRGTAGQPEQIKRKAAPNLPRTMEHRRQVLLDAIHELDQYEDPTSQDYRAGVVQLLSAHRLEQAGDKEAVVEKLSQLRVLLKRLEPVVIAVPVEHAQTEGEQEVESRRRREAEQERRRVERERIRAEVEKVPHE